MQWDNLRVKGWEYTSWIIFEFLQFTDKVFFKKSDLQKTTPDFPEFPIILKNGVNVKL